MLDTDFKEFMQAWKAAGEIYNTASTDAAIAMSFTVLKKYELMDIKKSISAYLSDPENGRFAPKPADIIKQLNIKINNDGRPEADEAWALAIKSFIESATVVTTSEISEALEMSAPIYLDGDKVGARMAFRSAYERIVKESRSNQIPVKWFASLGFDVKEREQVIQIGVDKGLLIESQVKQYLPAPITQEGEAIAGLLTGKVVDINVKNKKIVEHLKKLQEAIKGNSVKKKEKDNVG